MSRVLRTYLGFSRQVPVSHGSQSKARWLDRCFTWAIIGSRKWLSLFWGHSHMVCGGVCFWDSFFRAKNKWQRTRFWDHRIRWDDPIFFGNQNRNTNAVGNHAVLLYDPCAPQYLSFPAPASSPPSSPHGTSYQFGKQVALGSAPGPDREVASHLFCFKFCKGRTINHCGEGSGRDFDLTFFPCQRGTCFFSQPV